MSIEPPVAYQGGKTRLADTITNLLLREGKDQTFYDLCCGCGAVAIALVNKGIDPKRITMVDVGPWGDFWMRIGAGTFDLDYFRSVVDLIPKDPKLVKGFMESPAKQPINEGESICYKFLLLQAASFGAKPVSRDGWTSVGARWVTHGFRNFWLPTETSNRRSHVNPMMPMPETLLERVQSIAQGMKGVTGMQHDVTKLCYLKSGSVVYTDPPYGCLTAYARGLDAAKLAQRCIAEECVVFVSEAKPLVGGEPIRISASRKKGGVSGNRKAAHEEWISVFRPAKVEHHVQPSC